MEIQPKGSNKTLTISYRPGTTDEKVIPEVLKRCVYERASLDFRIDPEDRWLDLGGNIGTFALLCLLRGASVYSYEPEPENFKLLTQNVQQNFPHEKKSARLFQHAVAIKEGTSSLYICKGDYNKYRHTLCPKRGRSTIQVKVKSIRKVQKKHRTDCIKMDIEGAEIEILEGLTREDYVNMDLKKLVFEYSFDVDKSIPRFLSIIKRLREYFRVVHYDKVKENELEYKYFPACTIVFCLK
jgi:FkbM family methyltransferase